MSARRKTLLIVGLVMALGILYLGSRIPPNTYRSTVKLIYSDPQKAREKARKFFARLGPFGPIVFIVLQAGQVIISPIPGEATGVVGGYIFGAPLGFIYSTIGLTLGSCAAFGLGRWLGTHFVQRAVSPRTYHRFDFVGRPGGEILTFLLFVFPGAPKDVFCYILGISPMPFWAFFVISTLGRMPGTLGLTLFGMEIGKGEGLQLFLISAGAVFVLVLASIYRDRLYAWTKRVREATHHGSGPKD